MNWSNIAFTLPVFKLPNSQHRVVAITRTFICAAFTLRLHDSTVALNKCWSNYMLRFDDFATLVNSVPSIKCDFKWLLLMEKHFPVLRKEKERRWEVAGMYVFLQTVDILWRIKPLKCTQWKLTGKNHGNDSPEGCGWGSEWIERETFEKFLRFSRDFTSLLSSRNLWRSSSNEWRIDVGIWENASESSIYERFIYYVYRTNSKWWKTENIFIAFPVYDSISNIALINFSFLPHPHGTVDCSLHCKYIDVADGMLA